MDMPRVDYDTPWKAIIERYLPEFMAFFFPDVYREIAWERGYTFLDKELQQIVRDAASGSRRVDKLVRVYRRGDGAEIWVLIHILCPKSRHYLPRGLEPFQSGKDSRSLSIAHGNDHRSRPGANSKRAEGSGLCAGFFK